jgi:hypothetical protein
MGGLLSFLKMEVTSVGGNCHFKSLKPKKVSKCHNPDESLPSPKGYL